MAPCRLVYVTAGARLELLAAAGTAPAPGRGLLVLMVSGGGGGASVESPWHRERHRHAHSSRMAQRLPADVILHGHLDPITRPHLLSAPVARLLYQTAIAYVCVVLTLHTPGVLLNLTRAPTGGGGYPPPRRFFVDSGKTAARSAAKFGMTIPSSFLHIMCKL